MDSKDFTELRTVTPWAGTCGTGQKHTRLTVRRVQTASRKRRDDRRSLEKQHKAIKLHFTTAGTAFPLRFNALFEREEDFVSAAYLIPGILSAFIVQKAQRRPVTPYPLRFPLRDASTDARSSPLSDRSPSQVDAGGDARPLRSLTPTPRLDPAPRPGEDGQRGIPGGD